MKIRKIKNTAKSLRTGEERGRRITGATLIELVITVAIICNFFRCGDDIYHDRQQYIQKYIQ